MTQTLLIWLWFVLMVPSWKPTRWSWMAPDIKQPPTPIGLSQRISSFILTQKTKISSALWAPSIYLFTIQIKNILNQLTWSSLASWFTLTEGSSSLPTTCYSMSQKYDFVSFNQLFRIKSKWIKSFIFSPLLIAPSHHSLDLLLQPPPNFHSTISFDSSDTWLSPSQGFSFSTTTFSLGSIRSSSFARKSGLLTKEKNKN